MAVPAIIARMAALLLMAVLVAAVLAGAILHLFGLDQRVDNGAHASDAIFGLTGDFAAIYNRTALAGPGRHIILIGSSNAILIPATRMEQSINAGQSGHVVVDNMSVQGVSLPTFLKLVDLSYDGFGRSDNGHHLFVLAIWYGLFCRPVSNDHDDSFARLATHYGVYRETATGHLVANFAPPVTHAALSGLRPIIMAQRNFDAITSFGQSLTQAVVTGNAGQIRASEAVQNAVTLTPAQQREAIRQRRAGTTDANPAMMAYLDAIAQTVRQHGDRLMIVDLPLPRWHQTGIPQFARFRQTLAAHVRDNPVYADVSYVDFTSALADDEFYDSAHPKPASADRLSDMIAREILRKGLP
jgi:hypothetical protein